MACAASASCVARVRRVASAAVIVETTTELPQDTDADTVVIGVLDGEKIHHDIDGVLNGLVAAGEAKAKHRHLAVAHAGGKRWVLVGLGKRDELDGEKRARRRRLGARPRPRARREAAVLGGAAQGRPRDRGGDRRGHAADRLPLRPLQEQAAGGRRGGLEALVVSAHDDLTDVVARGGDRRARRQRRAQPAEHARQRDDAAPRSPTPRACSASSTA